MRTSLLISSLSAIVLLALLLSANTTPTGHGAQGNVPSKTRNAPGAAARQSTAPGRTSAPARPSRDHAQIDGERGDLRVPAGILQAIDRQGAQTGLAHAERVMVAPYPDMRLVFERTRVAQQGGSTAWFGRTTALPGASLTVVTVGPATEAVLQVPGSSEFALHLADGQATVHESDPASERCENDRAPRVTRPLTTATASVGPGRFTPIDLPVPDELNAEEEPTLFVDILFVYDSTAADYIRTIADDVPARLEARSRAVVETANGFLRNSGVTSVAWRFAGVTATPSFSRDGTFLRDVNAMSPGGALYTWVQEQRYRYGADQVVMLVGNAEGSGGRAATRYNDGSHRDQANEADWASLVVNVRSGAYTFAHEAAHNWGCWHDRANFFGTNMPTPDGDGFWGYGLRFTDNQGGITGTIMAYSDYKVPYFSNPELTVKVTTTLEGRSGPEIDLGTFTLGYPETHPKAANNARVLREHAAWMAALAEEITAPQIVSQPQSTSVERGRTISLQVTASGGGLSYQWLRNGIAIAGATSASFAKTATTADAGTYTVQVSNLKGTLTSNTAAVTVTGDTASPPPIAPPPQGGGGGGAISGWSLAALCVLLIGATLRRRRAQTCVQ